MINRSIFSGKLILILTIFVSFVWSSNVFAQSRTPSKSTVVPRVIQQTNPTTFTRTLEKGAVSDPEVKLLQEQLKKLGYYSFDVNGTFGPLTESALRAFQRASGIPETGIFNLETKNALIRAMNKGVTEPLLIRKRKTATQTTTEADQGICTLFVNTLPRIRSALSVSRGDTLLSPLTWFSVRVNQDSSSCNDVSISGVSLVVRKPVNAPKLQNIRVYRAGISLGAGEPEGSVTSEGNIMTTVMFDEATELTSDVLGDNTETFHIYADIPKSAPSGTVYEILVVGVNTNHENGGAVSVINESFRFAPSGQRKIIVQ